MRPVDTELLRDLPYSVLRRVRARFELFQIPAGGEVYRVGDRSDTVFVVLGGRFELQIEGELLPVLPGEVAGLTSFMADEPRSASLCTPTGGTLGVLHRSHLDSLWARYPELAARFELRIAELLVADLHRQNERLVALLRKPLHQVPAEVREMVGG